MFIQVGVRRTRVFHKQLRLVYLKKKKKVEMLLVKTIIRYRSHSVKRFSHIRIIINHDSIIILNSNGIEYYSLQL